MHECSGEGLPQYYQGKIRPAHDELQEMTALPMTRRRDISEMFTWQWNASAVEWHPVMSIVLKVEVCFTFEFTVEDGQKVVFVLWHTYEFRLSLADRNDQEDSSSLTKTAH
jgi:hypothetical protein